MKKQHVVKDIDFENGSMTLTVDDVHYKVDVKKVSLRLSRATLAQRQHYEISPSGYGISWPLIDEDLAVDGILARARIESRHSAHI